MAHAKKRIDADGLVVSLRPGSGATVVLDVTNPTNRPLTFCAYHTPFEGMRNDILVVHDARGQAVSYAGMMAKRAPPDDDDYITVAPGQRVSAPPLAIDAGYRVSGPARVFFRGGAICGLDASNVVDVDP